MEGGRAGRGRGEGGRGRKGGQLTITTSGAVSRRGGRRSKGGGGGGQGAGGEELQERAWQPCSGRHMGGDRCAITM